MRVLAFDFGASSGRAVLCDIAGGILRMKEVHRFLNEPVSICGTLYWDVLRLFREMKIGIGKAAKEGGFSSVGIDTWGVDFGLIDRNGKLIGNPVHYRDRRTDGIPEWVEAALGAGRLYLENGLQRMNFNTLYQLTAAKAGGELSRAQSMLLMPDLFGYFLTGEKHAEFSAASTTGLLDQRTGEWNLGLMEKLDLDTGLLPPLLDSGKQYGLLKRELCEELCISQVPVFAVAGHDTASAVVSVPAAEEFAFLSCGTWSLFGAELTAPILTETSEREQFTNERGYCRSVRFLKNIMGLWILQELKRQEDAAGRPVTFSELAEEAGEAQSFRSFIDTDDPVFSDPGDMVTRIRSFCRNTGQEVPETRGELARCVYESLAFKYRSALESLRRCTGKDYPCIHMVGGGCNAKLLCAFTANACGLPVEAGPSEGTAAGNALVQLIALGEIEDLAEARRTVRRSAQMARYLPEHTAEWEEAYQKYIVIGRKI